MERRLKIVAIDEDGKEIGYRYQRLFPEEMDASEYGISLKAKELFRDWLFSIGLWETFYKQVNK